jgi:hypothetical protein
LPSRHEGRAKSRAIARMQFDNDPWSAEARQRDARRIAGRTFGADSRLNCETSAPGWFKSSKKMGGKE